MCVLPSMEARSWSLPFTNLRAPGFLFLVRVDTPPASKTPLEREASKWISEYEGLPRSLEKGFQTGEEKRRKRKEER